MILEMFHHYGNMKITTEYGKKVETVLPLNSTRKWRQLVAIKKQ